MIPSCVYVGLATAILTGLAFASPDVIWFSSEVPPRGVNNDSATGEDDQMKGEDDQKPHNGSVEINFGFNVTANPQTPGHGVVQVGGPTIVVQNIYINCCPPLPAGAPVTTLLKNSSNSTRETAKNMTEPLCPANSSYLCLIEPVGCFRDSYVDPRPLPELIGDFRSDVDRNNMNRTIEACAREAKKRGFGFFGIQSYGDCWSGNGAEKSYNRDGPSRNCIRGVGLSGANFVYRFQNAKPESTRNPTTAEPTSNPTTAEPTTEPTTTEPTTEPTTAEPTTKPTTAEPTTKPTTAEPTTKPTTAEPTTKPTTAEPTTKSTTAEPTTKPTTVEPTTKPTEIPECKMETFDLVLVVDMSKSVGKENYRKLKNFLVDFTTSFHISESGVNVALIMFAGKAETLVKFGDPASKSKQKLKQEIEAIPGNLYWGTRTDLALEAAAAQFKEDRLNVPDVMILFTDGKGIGMKSPYSKTVPPLKTDGVNIFAVGLGKKIRESDLTEIADKEGHILMVKEFGDLKWNIKKVIQGLCGDRPVKRHIGKLFHALNLERHYARGIHEVEH